MATTGGKGGRKIGRNKRRAQRRGSPISLFVRDMISASTYWSLSGIRKGDTPV